MAKFEVGQRVKVNYRGWEGEGIIHSISYHKGWLNVDMQTGNYAKVQGAFSWNEVEPIVTFQPGDIVRAEKGDEIIQGSIYPPYDDGVLCLNVIEESYYLDYLTDERGYTLTLVKRPKPEIVLPTKNNALITFNSEKYIFNAVDGLWISLGTSEAYEVWEIKLLANVDDYRVIFEGENE